MLTVLVEDSADEVFNGTTDLAHLATKPDTHFSPHYAYTQFSPKLQKVSWF